MKKRIADMEPGTVFKDGKLYWLKTAIIGVGSVIKLDNFTSWNVWEFPDEYEIMVIARRE